MHADGPARPRVTQHCFGLVLECDVPLPGLAVGAGSASRRARLELAGDQAIAAEWSGARPERLRDERWPDGRLFMSIDHDELRGYRIEAPGHGLVLVAPDGAHILASFPDGPAWRWQLFAFAAVLPLAATLRGVELLHASGVSAGGLAFGLVGPSGAGKSSVAMHLVARGATFLTDDALALDCSGASVTAYPGARFANFHPHELDSLDATARARLGTVVGSSVKLHLDPGAMSASSPLGALYFLTRPHAGELRIEAAEDSARALLASTFVMHVQTPERLVTHLDVYSDVARRVPIYAVRVPARATAAEVAERLLRHIDAAQPVGRQAVRP